MAKRADSSVQPIAETAASAKPVAGVAGGEPPVGRPDTAPGGLPGAAPDAEPDVAQDAKPGAGPYAATGPALDHRFPVIAVGTARRLLVSVARLPELDAQGAQGAQDERVLRSIETERPPP